jgi:hypothetical protein
LDWENKLKAFRVANGVPLEGKDPTLEDLKLRLQAREMTITEVRREVETKKRDDMLARRDEREAASEQRRRDFEEQEQQDLQRRELKQAEEELFRFHSNKWDRLKLANAALQGDLRTQDYAHPDHATPPPPVHATVSVTSPPLTDGWAKYGTAGDNHSVSGVADPGWGTYSSKASESEGATMAPREDTREAQLKALEEVSAQSQLRREAETQRTNAEQILEEARQQAADCERWDHERSQEEASRMLWAKEQEQLDAGVISVTDERVPPVTVSDTATPAPATATPASVIALVPTPSTDFADKMLEVPAAAPVAAIQAAEDEMAQDAPKEAERAAEEEKQRDLEQARQAEKAQAEKLAAEGVERVREEARLKEEERVKDEERRKEELAKEQAKEQAKREEEKAHRLKEENEARIKAAEKKAKEEEKLKKKQEENAVLIVCLCASRSLDP